MQYIYVYVCTYICICVCLFVCLFVPRAVQNSLIVSQYCSGTFPLDVRFTEQCTHIYDHSLCVRQLLLTPLKRLLDISETMGFNPPPPSVLFYGLKT
jgi:hypothetical protein